MEQLISGVHGLCEKASAVIACVDENVYRHWREVVNGLLGALPLPTHLLIIPAGEESKSTEQALRCWSELSRLGADRNCLLLAVGGGVVCDLTGFLAATYMRGVRCVMLPTTLLAMVDAALGGKNGINLPEGKNLVGTFWDPEGVIADPLWLATLPERELCSGLAEVVKYGMIADPEILTQLESGVWDWNELISVCRTIKEDFVAQDPLDNKGIRRALNFGHTFGHALETCLGYGELRHGEAVAIGMCLALDVSIALELTTPSELDRLERLLVKLALPVQLPDVDVDLLIDTMRRDKKSEQGGLALILSEGAGSVSWAPLVDPELVRQVLERRRVGVCL